MNRSPVDGSDGPCGVVTITSTVPAASTGVYAVILVPALLTVKLAAGTEPNIDGGGLG